MKNQEQPAYFAYLKKIISTNLKDSLFKSEPLLQLIHELENLPADKQEAPILQLLTLYVESDHNKELGFDIAKSIPLTAYGDVGIAFRMAPNILDSIRLIAKYHQTIAPLFIYSFTVHEDTCNFEVSFNLPVPTKVEAVLVSAAIYSLFTELKVLGAAKNTIVEIMLNDCSSDYTSLYKKHIGKMPIIAGSNNIVRLNTKNLRSSNPLSDPETFKRIVEEIDNEAKIKVDASVVSKVTRFVRSHLNNNTPFSEVASALNLSDRQLRFALTKENTNYQEIIRQSKLEFATDLLSKSEVSISAIAHRLGYKDLAAFNHSFKRWTGESPSSYRKKHKAL